MTRLDLLEVKHREEQSSSQHQSVSHRGNACSFAQDSLLRDSTVIPSPSGGSPVLVKDPTSFILLVSGPINVEALFPVAKREDIHGI